MGSKKKAPPPPDYTKLAQQQADLQAQMLKQQTEANRPDQITAMGSLKWTQDPTTGRWTQTEQLNPEAQAALDQSLQLQTQQISQIGDLMKQGGFQGGPAMPTYDPTTGEQYAQRFSESLLGRMRPQQQQEQESMATKLRLQGLQPGTEAYDRAYRNLLTSHGDVTAQAQLQGLLAGGKEARDIYETQLRGQQQGYGQDIEKYLLPWQTAQMTQGLANSINMPQFKGFSEAGLGEAPQMMDAAQQQYAQQMQAYNEEQASKSAKKGQIGSLVGGVAGSFLGPMGTSLGSSLGGQLAGGGGGKGGSPASGIAGGGGKFLGMSDLIAKEDVRAISDEDAYHVMLKMIPISWAWSGTSVRDSGISAQQVLELLPELVNRGERGLLIVNYTKLFGILLGAFRHMAKMEKEAHDGHPSD